MVASHAHAVCGDGIIDAGEECDDGVPPAFNGVDCCNDSCDYEPAGKICASGSNICDAGQCDGDNTCVLGQIRPNCTAAPKSSLTLKRGANEATDKLIWKWLKGTQGGFTPYPGNIEYALCIYSGASPTAIAEAHIPASPLWSAGSGRFRYSDPTRAEDGIHKVLMSCGNGPPNCAAGDAGITLVGKGADLPDPPAGPLTLPITVQYVNAIRATCFEAVYDSADVRKNSEGLFKAKLP